VEPRGQRVDALFQVVARNGPELRFCDTHARVGSALE
jgi:hypothetical protein